jgi:hypothetical protein
MTDNKFPYGNKIVRDLMMSTSSGLKDDVRLPQAYLAILKRSDNDSLSEAAIQALVMTGETGRAVVAAKMKEQSIDQELGQKLLRGFDSKASRRAHRFLHEKHNKTDSIKSRG